MDDAAPAPVPQPLLDELHRRLRATRLVPVVAAGWERGTDHDRLAALIEHWAEGYDWRAAERRIAALPWARTANGMRLLHRRAADPQAPTVVLLHGWPDSFLRFERVLPLLTDVHVVVPCLPGYPHGGPFGRSGAAMAEPIAAALAELGHERYVVSGGDIGTSVAEALARLEPDRVAALHLTDVPHRHLLAVPDQQRSPEERAFLVAVREWSESEGAYAHEQGTKPATLAVGLGDSPAGLAAWIVEKLRSWSDCGGDVESVFPRDDLLTWISLYWFTGAIGTSFAPYSERRPPRGDRVAAPAVVSVFPADLLHAPRDTAERVLDVRAWREHDAGGHFAAWERPEVFVDDLRAAIALGAPQSSR